MEGERNPETEIYIERGEKTLHSASYRYSYSARIFVLWLMAPCILLHSATVLTLSLYSAVPLLAS
jgi:hypothetical protein